MDPMAHQDAESYQLIHSLMAISSGGWFGTGLGESMEKLFYLPEAHTDFLFAIITEELGFSGMVCLMMLFAVLLARIGTLAYMAFMRGEIFIGSILMGIGSWWGIQSIINIGVNMGCLPTKGLTLPFISYGGSSMVVCCAGMGLVMRCAYELHRKNS
jgi:cell division protein FtsW